MPRRQITRDMIEAALKKGWTASITSRHYGFHRKSIEAAAERFGIALPLGVSWAPPPQKTKPLLVWTDEIRDATKKNPVFSASKASIERALAKKSAEKRLQATG